MRLHPRARTYRVGHLFCGIGAGAKGFNDAHPRIGNVEARFECAGGVDWDAGAIANFGKLTGTPGTVLDLFNREQFVAFHGHEPPEGWREATPADIRRAHGDLPLDVMFLSAPCKGFSGLLSAERSATDKYQALNGLTLRGVWLALEAYKDDPTRIILFENVPRIETRGRRLLDQITALLRSYGYVIAETKHDCGEIGGLAQTRKRFLLVARHAERVPPFLYQPAKSPLRGVGEVIGGLPLPGDERAGPMHRVPSLMWKTWVRLAFVPAGKDWRALNDLEVVDGHLRDFGIVPEAPMRDNALGVLAWGESAPTLTSQRAPGQGRFSVADPREFERHHGYMGVRGWDQPTGTVTSRSGPSNGAHAVADPRGPLVADAEGRGRAHGKYPVDDWAAPSKAVIGGRDNGAYAVADPRVDGHHKSVQLGVRPWERPAGVVTGKMFAGGGPNSVADPRPAGGPKFNNVYRIVAFDAPARAVTGADGKGQCVADPRATWGADSHRNKFRVVDAGEPAPTVTGSNRVGSGALSVADARPFDCAEPAPLPEAGDRLVARIIARDGAWHRPFTTLELAALQSLFDPGEVFDLDGGSDQMRREWIGNAVPSAAARGMAETIGETLLLADAGETFVLSSREIWVKPLALALSVDSRQEVLGELV